MKRNLFLLPLLILLVACAARSSIHPSPSLRLYFASALDHGPALDWEPYSKSDPSAEELILALLEGPSSDNLSSPFPVGLSLRSCRLEDGLLTIDFSEQYGGLSAVDLTLADYTLVLTLCQLENVDALSITVSGRQLPYRSHHILSHEEALLALEESVLPLTNPT